MSNLCDRFYVLIHALFSIKLLCWKKKNCVVPDLFFSFQCHGFNSLQSYDTQ